MIKFRVRESNPATIHTPTILYIPDVLPQVRLMNHAESPLRGMYIKDEYSQAKIQHIFTGILDLKKTLKNFYTNRIAN